jgi:PST family polysaccharide transporter
MTDPAGEPTLAADGRPMAQVARGGASFAMAAQVIVLCVTFIGTFVLANLLSPASFGLIGIVAAATGAGDLLRDAGLSNAAIQAKRLSLQQRSNLLWTSVALGAAVSAVVFFSAPLLGSLYDNDQLVPITQAVAISFLLNAMASQHRASLSRQLRLKTTAFIDAFAAVASTMTAIVVAALTHSVWALVCQQLAGPVIALVLALSAARWLPLLPRRSGGIAPMLAYGFHQLGAQLAVYIGENVDTLIAGYRFSASEVGYYSRAYSLVTRPLTQVNVPASKLATPVLAQMQDDSELFNRYLLRAQRLVLVVTATALMLFASIVGPLVSLLLGDRWMPVAPLIQILAVGALFRVAAFSTAWIAYSRGLNKISLYANLCGLPVTVGAVLLGSVWGIEGIAVAQAFSGLSLWVLGLIWFSRVAGAPSWSMALAGLRTYATLVVPFCGGFLITLVLADANEWLALFLGAVGFLVIFGLEVLILRFLRDDVRMVVQMLPALSRRRSG